MQHYLTADPRTLLSSAANIYSQLSDVIMELATLRSDERREKAKVWEEAGQATTSSSARDRYSQIAALPYTTEIIETEARYRSLINERDFILLVLATLHGIHVNYPVTNNTPAIS